MEGKLIELLKKIKHFLEEEKKIKIAREYNCFVPNINLTFTQKQLHILLSYSPCTFQFLFQKSGFRHSNGQEITEIVHLLIKRGYCIDVIDCTCRNPKSFILGRKYDYIIGFGDPYRVAHELNPNAKTIFFMTENLPSYVKNKFQERCDYYYERHRKSKIGIKRDAALFKDEYLNFSDFIISINSRKRLPEHKEYLLYPSGLLNSGYEWHTKDFEKAKYNFVWFGSPGAIHKGLDILIDVFAFLPKCHLYIYGLDGRERFLMKGASNNIHNQGTISVLTNDYIKDIVEKCAFVIFPSCSEGISTGVITNMLHGLVPVVTEECNIPQGSYSVLLESFRCEYIQSVIERLVEMSNDDLERMSKESYDFARRSFTLDAYSKSVNDIFNIIFNCN